MANIEIEDYWDEFKEWWNTNKWRINAIPSESDMELCYIVWHHMFEKIKYLENQLSNKK